MSETYVYKRKPGRGVIWLAAAVTLALCGGVYLWGAANLLPILMLFAALTAAWVFLPRPTYGIKVDGSHLTLGAWRKPRPIPLDSIAYIQASEISDEINYVIVYRDEEREGIFALDLPDEDTLVEIMAERGIPVRGGI